jgi:hypothetical protein
MTTEIAIRGNVDLAVIAPLSEFAEKIAKTDFVPSNMRNRPEAVLACMMTGQEIGIPPMQALRQIDVIEGRPALRAELMRAMVLDQGHEIWTGEGQEFTTSRVVYYGRRAGSSNVIRVEWNEDMARKAGLTNKNNWKNHMRQMLSARASSELCRILFPDVIAGMGYTAEELQDGFDDGQVVDGEIVESEPTKKAAPAKRARPARKSPEPARSSVPIPEPDLPGDEIIDAETIDEPEQSAEQKSRSMQVVKLAKALGIDHHPVVSAVTNGVTESARMLEADDAANVMDALRGISEGRLQFAQGHIVAFEPDQRAEPPLEDDVIDAEVVADEDPEEWDSHQWRSYVRANDVKVVALLKKAANITPPGQNPVGSLGSISGSGIAQQLKDWVDEQS